MSRSLRLAAATFLLLTAAACTADVDVDFYGKVLAAEDGRSQDAEVTWQPLYRLAPDAMARARVVRAVGRVRAPALVAMLIEWWSEDPPATIAEEILFALGQVGDAEASVVLEAALHAPPALLRARAAEALGKVGGPTAVAALLPLLRDADSSVREATLLALVRLRGRRAAPTEAVPAATEQDLFDGMNALLDDTHDDVRWRAAYAFAEIELSGRLTVLEPLTRAIDARTRLFSVRSIARLDGDDRQRHEILEEVLDVDIDVHVAAAAATGLGRLAALESLPVLSRAASRRAQPADHHVRQAALAALGLLPTPAAEQLEALRSTLDRALADTSTRARAAALETHVVHFPGEAQALLTHWSRRPDKYARVAAARAASRLPSPSAAVRLLAPLIEDPEPLVVTAALAGLAGVPTAEEAARQAALSVLGHADLAVRGAALAALETIGTAADVPAIAVVWQDAHGSDGIEVRVAALKAAVALSREAAESLLSAALGDPAIAVREAAASHLPAPRTTGSPSTALHRTSSVAARAGQDFLTFRDHPRVRLETTRGTIEIELFPDAAPRHVRSFLQRTREGLYDGLPFHRVVSGFVVQGLDPRGDGWGSGGVFLRDEINPVLYGRGAVGMPNAGPDSGGCQIFITHVPTPHLDGGYTVFGQVVAGMEVVDALDVGDVCLQVTAGS